jgi:hypothetical protein
VRRGALRALRAFFSPLLPDDYLELINPLWSTQELRGRIERIARETDDAVTIFIRPGHSWPGHQPGSTCASASSSTASSTGALLADLRSRPRGRLDLDHAEARAAGQGHAAPGHPGQAGAIVRLGGVEGDFVLPDPAPEKLLFISAGSGITPIMSMVRHLAGNANGNGSVDAVHVHSARTETTSSSAASCRRSPTARPA